MGNRRAIAQTLASIAAQLLQRDLTIADALATAAERIAVERRAEQRVMLAEVEKLEQQGRPRAAIAIVARRATSDPTRRETIAQELRRARRQRR